MATFDFSQNYFSLFQIPESFAVDVADLSKRYRSLQRQMHPDRYAGSDAQQQRLAIQYSAFINQAFETLKSPVDRGRYLLELLGQEFDFDGTVPLDNMFLMQQMELRETLAELRQAEGDSQQSGLKTLMDELIGTREKLLAEIAATIHEKHFELAAQAIAKLQFIQKIHEEADELQQQYDTL